MWTNKVKKYLKKSVGIALVMVMTFMMSSVEAQAAKTVHIQSSDWVRNIEKGTTTVKITFDNPDYHRARGEFTAPQKGIYKIIISDLTSSAENLRLDMELYFRGLDYGQFEMEAGTKATCYVKLDKGEYFGFGAWVWDVSAGEKCQFKIKIKKVS